MRKLLLLIALLPILAHAQAFQKTAPDCEFEFRFNVVAGTISSTTTVSASRLPLSPQGSGYSQSVVGFDNRPIGCTSWTITGQTQGVSSVSIELDQAPIASTDMPGTWSTWTTPAPGTVLPLTATGTLQASAFGYNPWVSILLNSANGTGTVYGRVYGWRPQAGADVTSPGNSVVIAGFTYKAITTSTNTQVKATPGIVHTLTITQPGATSQSITLVDSSAANCSGGTTIATIPSAQLVSTMVPDTLTLDVATVNGICVTTAGTTAPQLVVSFR